MKDFGNAALIFAAAGVLVSLGWGAWALLRRRSGPTAGPPSTPPRKASEPAERGAPATGDRPIAGKYRLTRPIGRGAMGEVFEGWDEILRRPVALKRISKNLRAFRSLGREIFIREARAVAAVHHPSIVEIYEIVEDGEDVYQVFELLRGRTLRQVLDETRRLPLRRAAEVLGPVCEALQFAHDAALVHCDLKPGNVMVLDDGRIKLLDFGIAHALSEDAPRGPAEGPAPASVRYVQATVGGGTPAYMAPEAEQGIVCKEADIFSLGVSLYEMVTGSLPYNESSFDMTNKYDMNYTKPSAIVPGLSPDFDRLIDRALDPNPETRIRTPREFIELLRKAAADS